MFPLRDENPTELTPFVTFIMIGVSVVAWLLLQGAGTGREFLDSLCQYGSIPAEITGALREGETIDLGGYECRVGGARWSSLLTSMFMHGGWMHLIGNMWFLWVFGNNIEDSMGHLRFAVFYLLTGVLASVAQVLAGPGSPIPTVGASGAISGIMGAYLLLYPRVRIFTFIFLVIFFRIIPVPAWVMLGYWFVLQLFMGASDPGGDGGVAFMAHIGGFVAGLALIKLFQRQELVDARRAGVR